MRTGVTASGMVGDASSENECLREEDENVLVEEKERVVVGDVSKESPVDVGVFV